MENIEFICPVHKLSLKLDEVTKDYKCKKGCVYILNKGIYRFVESEKYTTSFGIQWNYFRNLQLDSYNGTSISHDRLKRIVGGDLNIFNGKRVLEAGCGSGRFTELMLKAGACVYANDLSNAVEANYYNCRRFKNYFGCQADIYKLPYIKNSFDIVFCIGVIQHTPSPENTISLLCSYIKPGGYLFIDHYTHDYPLPLSRKILRSILKKTSPEFAFKFCEKMTKLFLIMHNFLYKLRDNYLLGKIYSILLKISPMVDYNSAYKELSLKDRNQMSILDTHDTLTDQFKHFRSEKQIREILLKCNMSDIKIIHAGNGIEACAKKQDDSLGL